MATQCHLSLREQMRCEKELLAAPPPGRGPGEDIDETSLRADRASVMVAVHPAARQRYA